MQGVIYTRVSSDEQIKGMSLDFQREDCTRYAAERGIEILKVFEERGESAKVANRPVLVELLEFCRKRQRSIDALIVWKLDRLSRNQLDYYFLKRTLLGYGIALHSATEPSIEDASSIAGKVFETFSALQAEIENSIRRDRAVRGMAAKIAAGIYPWQPPLGYRSAHNRLRGLKKTEPDEPDERFALVQRLFRTCLDDGVCGSAELSRHAKLWGLRTRSGKPLYPQMIDQILRNRFYAGVVTDPWTGDEFPGKHRPMISRDEFHAIQRLRKGKPALGKPRRTRHPDFPLRRTARCASCQGSLTGSWSRGNGGRYPYYHCAHRGCPMYGKGIPKDTLEQDFRERLAEVTPRPGAVRTFKAVMRDAWANEAQCDRNVAEQQNRLVAELQERLDAVFDMRERGVLTDQEFLERKRKVQEQLGSARHSLGRAKTVEVDIDRLLTGADRMLRDLPARWQALGPDKQPKFQLHVFPSGIPYDREHGFGTAELGPLYAFFRDTGGSRTAMVRHVGATWNQLLENLAELEIFAESSEDDVELDLAA